MKHHFEIKQSFPVEPAVIYQAWLDSETHTNMTGGAATASDQWNEAFSAWDGYITGTNKVLEPNRKIVQSWRTTEFKETDADSELTIELAPTEGGCELTLTHKDIPADQPNYEQGWQDHYFGPMLAYFSAASKTTQKP